MIVIKFDYGDSHKAKRTYIFLLKTRKIAKILNFWNFGSIQEKKRTISGITTIYNCFHRFGNTELNENLFIFQTTSATVILLGPAHFLNNFIFRDSFVSGGKNGALLGVVIGPALAYFSMRDMSTISLFDKVYRLR